MKMRKSAGVNPIIFTPLIAVLFLGVYEVATAKLPINIPIFSVTVAIIAVVGFHQYARAKHYILIDNDTLSLSEGNHRMDIAIGDIHDIDYSNNTLSIRGKGMTYKFKVSTYKPAKVIQIVKEVLQRMDGV